MEKDFTKRAEELRKIVSENGGSADFENPGEVYKKVKKGKVKLCPFSLAMGGLPCGSWCQIHRDGRMKYACPFQEIPVIGWNTSPKNKNNH